MPISFSCATCGKPYVVDDRFAGKKAACRMCGNVNWIPSAEYAGVRPNPQVELEQPEPPAVPGARPGVIPDDFDPLPLSVVDRSNPAEEAKADEADEIPMAELDEEPDNDSGTLDLVEDDAPPPPPRVKAAPVSSLPAGSLPPFPAAPVPVRPVPAQAAQPAPVKPFVKPLKALPVEGCPNCGEILGEKAIFCTACGYNLKTGKAASTTVHADDDEDDNDHAGALPEREPNTALRSTALFLIAGGVGMALLGVMALPIPGLRAMTMVGPLVGALLCMIGGVIYFIDGAMPFAMAGGGATVFALIILFSIGRKSEPPPPPPPPVAIAPATVPTSQPDPPKVERTGPDTFTVRKPKAGENVILYWRPVIQDADPGIRLVAIEQLKKVQDPWKGYAADEIATRAAEEDLTVRKSAMANLSIAATPKTVAAAIKGLDDSDEEVARLALAALAKFKSEEAISALAGHYAKLGDPVLEALAGYGEKSNAKVAEAYRTILAATTDPAVRGRVMGLIVKTGPEAAGAILVQYVADNDPQVRALAMNHLAELKYAPAVPAIIDRLTTDPGPAGKALIAYGPVAEKGLLEKLGGGDPKLKVLVLGVLKETATNESLAVVQAAAKDADMTVALAARQVWRKIDPAGLSPLDEALMDLGGSKPFALRALESLRSLPMDERRGEVAKRLFGMLGGGGGGVDAEVQNGAADVLKTWADDATRDAVIAALKPDGGDEAKRAQAIKLAVHFKDARAVKPLVDCLAQNRATPEVMAALQEFGTAPEEHLIKLLQGGDTNIIEKSCELLREIGTRRCFRALTAIASNKGGDERMKKLANQTMIDINRRLNTAEAAAARGGAATTHAADGTTQPTTRPGSTTRLTRPTTRPNGPSLW